ncbi:malonate--CoA ligase ACSF3, mitochondrial-like isoform X2 [Corticium candelabrum]|uniref:malonate--CoA ligase ACSF3, mitochondrial-like isoform X2 n=1 Tax=Corticium candelabrum TaxID=121492 RepID=UPI002E260466|nr:malonate--CoA ligase ACSF3, mitochondrial-like isoform X2 [Corticium candelabrum]
MLRHKAILQTKHLLLFMRHCSAMTVQPLHARAGMFRHEVAIVDTHGHYTYQQLINGSTHLSSSLREVFQSSRFTRKHCMGVDYEKQLGIAFLCPNDVSYTLVQWATWKYGGVAIPLCGMHPLSELEYVILDSLASVVVSSGSSDNYNKISSIANKLRIFHYHLNTRELLASLDIYETENEQTNRLPSDQPAQIVYTSGTTGRPKGVVVTHGNLVSQITAQIESWGWTQDDCMLHVLPLHHVHGIVNALACPLWCGAICHMLPEFDAAKVWDLLLHRNSAVTQSISMLTAVPTVYFKLIKYYEQAGYNKNEKEDIKQHLQSKIRLMISGSAPLSTTTMEKWHNITGHWLLERYGMTEVGMALSNPLYGTRSPGAVGRPLPSVSVRICDSESETLLAEGDSRGTVVYSDNVSVGGLLQIKGPSVFPQYWNRPAATEESFTKDGWFITGDTAGRTSVDIIKSGGYKISALEVERHLLCHPAIAEIAVVGIDDKEWGQLVAAVVVHNHEIDVSEVQQWSKSHIPPYAVPRLWKFVNEIPRNSMGKVNKKALAKIFDVNNQQDKQLLVNSYFHDLVFPSH